MRSSYSVAMATLHAAYKRQQLTRRPERFRVARRDVQARHPRGYKGERRHRAAQEPRATETEQDLQCQGKNNWGGSVADVSDKDSAISIL